MIPAPAEGPTLRLWRRPSVWCNTRRPVGSACPADPTARKAASIRNWSRSAPGRAALWRGRNRRCLSGIAVAYDGERTDNGTLHHFADAVIVLRHEHMPMDEFVRAMARGSDAAVVNFPRRRLFSSAPAVLGGGSLCPHVYECPARRITRPLAQHGAVAMSWALKARLCARNLSVARHSRRFFTTRSAGSSPWKQRRSLGFPDRSRQLPGCQPG